MRAHERVRSADRKLAQACVAVLRDNDRGGHTVPSPRLYPHQWAWDSAFIAIGLAHIDPPRAVRELTTLMAAQWDDGRVPHVIFHDKDGDYFPGPDFWRTRSSSSITQPPLWATAARRLVEVCDDAQLVAPLIAAFERSHEFYRTQRDPLGIGAVAVVHPWESGLDNSPTWDAPLARVDVSRPPSFRRRDTDVVGDARQRPTDEQYLRYACLVEAIARDDFGPGPFRVYDPMMTTLLLRAERDLCWLAERVGFPCRAAERAERLAAGLQQLYDEQRGRFAYHDAVSDLPCDADVIGCYLPALVVDEPQKGRLCQRLASGFASEFGLRSTARDDPAYEPQRYWRGPVWININWLLCDLLGDALIDQTIELVRRSGFFEYFHGETGVGLGGERFSWTAALTLDLIYRRQS